MSASGRLVGGKPLSRGALYLILQNRISRGSGSPEIKLHRRGRRRARPADCGYPCRKPEASSARRETTLQREIAVKNVSLGIFDPARCRRNPDFLGGFPPKPRSVLRNRRGIPRLSRVSSRAHEAGMRELWRQDANPGDVVSDFLTNPRYGAGFNPALILNVVGGAGGNAYGDYCQAAGLLISVALDGQQKALEWLDGMARLTNTAVVWSAKRLQMIPYGDLTLNNNGTTWTPNLVPQYSLTDNDFLPWHPIDEENGPTP